MSTLIYFKKKSIFLILLLTGFTLSGQGLQELYTIISYPAMPKQIVINQKVKETSGLAFWRDQLWTLNDSNNDPELYKLDTETGEIIQTLEIEGVANNDWEELDLDDRFIFIGDFGNNRGSRKDLAIYAIKTDDIPKKKNKKITPVEIIRFTYAEQTSFDPGHNHNFDCEAMISFGDSLLLFTKNRGNLKTNLYRIAKTPGEYQIKSIGSFDTDGLVTGASFNKDNRKLLLIGYKEEVPFIFVFKNFNGNFNGSKEVYRFNFVKMKGSQTEGICWINDHEIYISSEQTEKFQPGVFKLDLKKIFDVTGLEWE